MYIGNDQLRAELEKSIARGRMTEEFAEMVCIIARGHIAKRFSHVSDHSDYHSAFHDAIVRNWRKIDQTMNIHSYICRMAENRSKNVIRSQARYNARLTRYRVIETIMV